ncbi:unnamed protein product, partial [Polarella glacialis]
FTVAAFGARKAGRLLGDPGAAQRQRRGERAAALGVSGSTPAAGESEEGAGDEVLDEEADANSTSQDFPDEEAESAVATAAMPPSWRKSAKSLKNDDNSNNNNKNHKGRQRKALKALRAEEKRLLERTRALAKEAMRAARLRGREALKAARLHWQTPAGRAAAALTCAGLTTDGLEVLRFEESTRPSQGEVHLPGQLVVVDHSMGCVVVALRGSSCLRDVILDLNFKPESFTLGACQGIAHAGMLRAARSLDEPIAAAVQLGLQKLSGPGKVLLCGHSLGAGVASLLTALWTDSKRLPTAELRCLAFACPQVLGAKHAAAAASHTTSFVLGADCVPCLGLASATDLRNALMCLQDPAAYGLDSNFSASALLALAERSDTPALAAAHDTVLHA